MIRAKSSVSSEIPYNLDYFRRTKDVWVLDRDIVEGSKKIHLKKSELKFKRTDIGDSLNRVKLEEAKMVKPFIIGPG